MIRVVVVDDHPVVLTGLTALIGAEGGMTVVGTAGSVQGIRELDVSPPPEVCVVDLHLPDGDGVTLGLELKRRWPCRVLVLTMSADPAGVVRSLGEGLDGYLLKDSDPDELIGAIRTVATGAMVLGRGARMPMVSATHRAAAADDPLGVLDARDREILALLVQGQTTQHIASQLFLAPKTIRNRISEMLTKLRVSDREAAVALARSVGLVPDPRGR